MNRFNDYGLTEDERELYDSLNIGDYVFISHHFRNQKWFSYKPTKITTMIFGYLIDTELKNNIHISYIMSAKQEIRKRKLKRLLDEKE